MTTVRSKLYAQMARLDVGASVWLPVPTDYKGVMARATNYARMPKPMREMRFETTLYTAVAHKYAGLTRLLLHIERVK